MFKIIVITIALFIAATIAACVADIVLGPLTAFATVLFYVPAFAYIIRNIIEEIKAAMN